MEDKMDKKNVVAKFEGRVNGFGAILAEVLMRLSEVPAGTLSEVAVNQIVNYLRHDSACLWATVELMHSLNKSGKMPFSSYEMSMYFNAPATQVCIRKEEVIFDLEQAMTLHKMYSCIW